MMDYLEMRDEPLNKDVETVIFDEYLDTTGIWSKSAYNEPKEYAHCLEISRSYNDKYRYFVCQDEGRTDSVIFRCKK